MVEKRKLENRQLRKLIDCLKLHFRDAGYFDLLLRRIQKDEVWVIFDPITGAVIVYSGCVVMTADDIMKNKRVVESVIRRLLDFHMLSITEIEVMEKFSKRFGLRLDFRMMQKSRVGRDFHA